MNSAIFREMVNGAAVTPELICLVLLAVYLSKESRRRGLNSLDWFHLPPSMNLVLAIFIFDLGVTIRSTTIWIWHRFYNSGDMGDVLGAFLILGGILIVVGALCKIRALTEPDHGFRPWLLAAALTAIAIIVLVALR
jgi:hypothetical protein